MRKQLYQAVCEQLKNIRNEKGESVIRHFDLWNQNVASTGPETFAMPAVFIEFPPISWLMLPHGIQEANITLNLHVITRWDTPSTAGNPDQTLEYLGLLDQIHIALHRFSGENFNSFTRTGSTTNHNHEGILDSLEVYTTHVFDHSAERK